MTELLFLLCAVLCRQVVWGFHSPTSLYLGATTSQHKVEHRYCGKSKAAQHVETAHREIYRKGRFVTSLLTASEDNLEDSLLPLIKPPPPRLFIEIFHDGQNCPLRSRVMGSKLYDQTIAAILSAWLGDGYDPEIMSSCSVTWRYVYPVTYSVPPKSRYASGSDEIGLLTAPRYVLRDLQTRGVIHVNPGDKKGAVDVVIKDMMENLRSGHSDDTDAQKRRRVIVLISGDRDFASDMRSFMQNGFKTVLIHEPLTTSNSFVDVFSKESVIDWAQLSKKCENPVESGTGFRKWSEVMSSSSSQESKATRPVSGVVSMDRKANENVGAIAPLTSGSVDITSLAMDLQVYLLGRTKSGIELTAEQLSTFSEAYPEHDYEITPAIIGVLLRDPMAGQLFELREIEPGRIVLHIRDPNASESPEYRIIDPSEFAKNFSAEMNAEEVLRSAEMTEAELLQAATESVSPSDNFARNRNFKDSRDTLSPRHAKKDRDAKRVSKDMMPSGQGRNDDSKPKSRRERRLENGITVQKHKISPFAKDLFAFLYTRKSDGQTLFKHLISKFLDAYPQYNDERSDLFDFKSLTNFVKSQESGNLFEWVSTKSGKQVIKLRDPGMITMFEAGELVFPDEQRRFSVSAMLHVFTKPQQSWRYMRLRAVSKMAKALYFYISSPAFEKQGYTLNDAGIAGFVREHPQWEQHVKQRELLENIVDDPRSCGLFIFKRSNRNKKVLQVADLEHIDEYRAILATTRSVEKVFSLSYIVNAIAALRRSFLRSVRKRQVNVFWATRKRIKGLQSKFLSYLTKKSK